MRGGQLLPGETYSPIEDPKYRLTPGQIAGLGQATAASVNLNSLRDGRLPTAAAGSALLQGDMSQLVPAVAMFLGRAAQIGLGIFLSGTWDDKRSIKNAFAGSAAVQAFLFGYLLLDKSKDLPSSTSAQALINKERGSGVTLAAHWLARSAIIGTGMYFSGQRENLVKQALSGGAIIEVAVLSWAATQKRKKNQEAQQGVVS